MTNGARNRQRRYGSNGYALEYPEFGQLLLMLLEFLANYFKSLFPGLTPPKSGAEPNQDDSDNDLDNDDSDNDEDYTPSPSYTPGMRARSAQRPANDTHTATYSSSNRPSRR